MLTGRGALSTPSVVWLADACSQGTSNAMSIKTQTSDFFMVTASFVPLCSGGQTRSRQCVVLTAASGPCLVERRPSDHPAGDRAGGPGVHWRECPAARAECVCVCVLSG
ncbi:unnamed protein product [Prorocentrum cordatum]|uniref:Uncharacterized protein n=1 Tax=Prorocentrum cordatum TaxID=2364126 RepID=A0ABN9R987_9DINO|nr:unnamed protein product [Polarella glacialis]